MIRIRNLHYSVGQTPILNGVDLDIPEGGVTAIIGPNGAGKSTLLSLIARLLPLQQGEIDIGGHLIGQVSDRDLARILAIMPQSSDITARLTIEDLVGFGRYPWHRGRPRDEDRQKVAAALGRFGLTDLRRRFIDEVSGGQKQRALAATAFVQETPFLLLDEPLNNLDIAASRDLMRILNEMSDKDGKAIVVVMHDINYAIAFADRLVVMKEGRVVAQGHPAEIVTGLMIRDVFSTEVDVEQVRGRPIVLV
ncbi:iron ABC transporter ATP-binding protein [Pseudooceanicola sp. C21-150M6]|uniref:iron ABC transporter ATP-binding protein n=1 Tax=Pseudooceanicola sp. C21-150M6 TaxID=3434355 RepID=UPI003D7FC3EF